MTRPGWPRKILALAACVAAVAATTAARADDTQACLAAAESAQKLRNAGKLTEAREQLVICGRTDCPKLVQRDCTQWMTEVLAVLPSFVPAARDADGRDLVDVTVSVDGVKVAESLDGNPLPIDPGVHTLRFETSGAPAIEEKVVLRQGEKNRIVAVTFARDAGGPAPELVTPPREEDPRSAPIAAYVVGGLGIATLGAALYLNLDANADARELRDTCAPRCPQADVDDVEKRQLISGITAAVGGAALIAGVVLFIVHRSSRKGGAAAAMSLSPAPGGAVATFRF
jgi:hypothetical protein